MGWLPSELKEASELLACEIRVDVASNGRRLGWLTYGGTELPQVDFANGTALHTAAEWASGCAYRSQMDLKFVFNDREVTVNPLTTAAEIMGMWYGEDTAEVLQPRGIALNAVNQHGVPITVQNPTPGGVMADRDAAEEEAADRDSAEEEDVGDVLMVAVPTGMNRRVLQQLVSQVIDMWNVAKIHAEAQQVRAETGTPLPTERTRAIDLGGSDEQS